MPQNSVPYAISRTRVLEGRLLTMERLQRLLETSSAADVLRVLNEYGYGGNAQEPDIQKLVHHELSEAYEYVRRVTPNEYATGVLLLKGDCHNCKSILKAKLLNFDAKPYLRDSGAVEAKKLYEAMQDGDVSLLSEHMQEAARRILGRMELGSVEVQWMECQLDAACFADMSEYAKKSGEDVAMAFVQTQADLLNVITLLRIKRTQGGEQMLRGALLPGGTADVERFVSALDIGDEPLLSHVRLNRYAPSIGTGVDAVQKGGTFGLLERQCDDVLLKMLRDKRYARQGVAPLLGYLLAKQREAQAVRLIYLSRRNEVPAAMTQERLRELYA